jgi:hypothetical protein
MTTTERFAKVRGGRKNGQKTHKHKRIGGALIARYRKMSSSGGLVDIVFSLPASMAPEPVVISVTSPAPLNLNEIHPTAATSNVSFEYSGRHDQGTLPTLKTEGHLANVISAILEAKQQSDTILTKLIEEHQATTSTGGKNKSSIELDELEAYCEQEGGRKKKSKRVAANDK